MNDGEANKLGESGRNKDDWDLYTLLIQEEQNLHNRWIDNFRVILTFNSILLPGSIAIFLLLAREDVLDQARKLAPGILIVAALVGIVVTLVGAAFVSRLRSIGNLRHNEIRHIEDRLQESLLLRPFYEGRLLLDGEHDELRRTREDSLEAVGIPQIGKLSGYRGYRILVGVFLVAYFLLLCLGVYFFIHPLNADAGNLSCEAHVEEIIYGDTVRL